jgi:hypothetical protein
MLQLRGFSGTRDKVRELQLTQKLLVGSAGALRKGTEEYHQGTISTTSMV